MSYQANLDIAIAMDKLQIRSFKKQGTIRFKINLFSRSLKDQEEKHSNVTDHLFSIHIPVPFATPTMSTKAIRNLLLCFYSSIKTERIDSSSKYGTEPEHSSKETVKISIKV